MAKAKNKTTASKKSVTAFLDGIKDPHKKRDAKQIAKMLRRISGKRATMWGPSIVGFGKYQYKYASGREGEFLRIGFSPRKQNLVVYILPGYSDFGALLKKLGPHKKGKSCLYLKRLDDVDLKVLERLMRAGWKDMEKRYGKA